MDEDRLKKAVQDEYKRVYPKWEHPIRVTQTVPETFGGTLVVVNGKDDEGEIVDEMCFVFENDKVQVFSSTEQLAIFLDSRARLPWYQRIFATSILSGIVFLLSILLVFVAGIVPFISQTRHFGERVIAILAAVVGSASGFYFGSARSRG